MAKSSFPFPFDDVISLLTSEEGQEISNLWHAEYSGCNITRDRSRHDGLPGIARPRAEHHEVTNDFGFEVVLCHLIKITENPTQGYVVSSMKNVVNEGSLCVRQIIGKIICVCSGWDIGVA